jgi:membrane-associated phospholipid phosphatase
MRAARLLPLALCLLIMPARLAAQAADTPPADKKPVAKAAADTGKYALITTKDLLYMGGFMVATVGVSRLDRQVAQDLQDTSKIPSLLTTRTARTFNLIGVPGAFIVSGGMYAIGRIGGVKSLADAGLHTGEAVVLAEAMTYLVKYAFGRERPYLAGTDHPGLFAFGRGFKGNAYSSFPSGHASAAFASAGAVTAEVSSRWPKATWVVAPVMYGSAAMVAWARLQSNKHWLSDVFLGAGMGTMIGIKVVRFNHKHPKNAIDRMFLAAVPTVLPDGAGSASLALMWTVKLQ